MELEGTKKPYRVAYLGPAGTYCAIALEKYRPEAEAIPCSTISGAFELVLTGQVDASFVPIENMIKGPVTETFDLLLEHQGTVFIRDSYVMPIIHSIGIISERAPKDGDVWSSITTVYSHIQALQQCSKFIQKKLPQAKVAAIDSTTRSMELVRDSQEFAAVIGAKESLLAHGYTVIAENIANVTYNKTRFVLICKGNVEDMPIEQDTGVQSQSGLDYVTSLAINPKRDRQGILRDMLDVISNSHKVNMLSIHSRPDAFGGFVFYLDLEGHICSTAIAQCLADLRQYCTTLTGDTAEISVFGCYPREAFKSQLFRRIGIVGGDGIMGSWFRRFFSNLGFEVYSTDKDREFSLQDLSAKSDVIILSLPMSEVESVAKELAPFVRKDQLVVENCSIKHSAIPFLEASLPADVEVLGIHTMFGGDISNLKGENIIVTRTASSSSMANAFEELLYKYGAKIVYADVATHDYLAAFSQSLQQLCMIVLGEVLADSYESIGQVNDFASRNSRQLLSTIKRVLRQNNYLINDLQTRNPEAKILRRRFLETAFHLVSALANDNFDEVISSVEKTRKFFGSELDK